MGIICGFNMIQLNYMNPNELNWLNFSLKTITVRISTNRNICLAQETHVDGSLFIWNLKQGNWNYGSKNVLLKLPKIYFTRVMSEQSLALI